MQFNYFPKTPKWRLFRKRLTKFIEVLETNVLIVIAFPILLAEMVIFDSYDNSTQRNALERYNS